MAYVVTQARFPLTVNFWMSSLHQSLVHPDWNSESNNDSGPYFDTGYDAGADAFLFGRLDFVTIGVGSVDFFTESGKGKIVNGNQIVPATFGSVTIVGQEIPEPSSCAVFTLMSAGFLSRREKTPSADVGDCLGSD